MRMMESNITTFEKKCLNNGIMVHSFNEVKGFGGKTRLTSILRNITTSQFNKKSPVHLGYLSDCTEKRPHDTLTSPTMSVIAYYLTRYPHFNNSHFPKKMEKAAQKVLVPLKVLQQLTAWGTAVKGTAANTEMQRDRTVSWERKMSFQ